MDSNFYKHSKGRVVPVRNRKAVIHIEVERPIIGAVVEVPASLRETAQQALIFIDYYGSWPPPYLCYSGLYKPKAE